MKLLDMFFYYIYNLAISYKQKKKEEHEMTQLTAKTLATVERERERAYLLENKKIEYIKAYSSRCIFAMCKNYARDG